VSGRVALATVLAVWTAFLYALSNVLEMLEAEQIPDEFALKMGLLTRLIKRPRWLLGLLSDFGGYIFHAAALGLAAVVFVEPILASGILMSLFIASAFVHRPIKRTDWIACGILSAGLALFLYEVSPTGGKELGDRTSWFFTGIGAAAIVLVCLWAGKATAGPPRAAFLGVAAGIMFGIAALLTKALVHFLGDGIFAWVPHWEPYALAVAAIGGVIVAQSALQTGQLGAAVGATESMSVISGAILGLFVLNERVGANNAFEIFAVVVSIVMVLGGIVWLSQTQEQMIRRAGRQHRGEEPNPST
jgi:drug/metabolite transporter (DMT)-like permease